MADYATLVNALHKALTGGDQLGQYPDSVQDRLMRALDAAWDLADNAGVSNKVPVIAGDQEGPWGATPTTKLADAKQQVAARYRFDAASRPRTLAEQARQLEAILALLGETTTTPPPPPVTPPSIVPANATLVGALDYDTGDLTQWSNVQNKDRNGSAAGYSTWRASVRDGGDGHTKAARFEVRPGDVPNFGGGERSEVTASSTYNVKSGQETWYSWSMRLGDANGVFPSAAGWGLIVMQWHSNEGSPPLSIHAEGGQISLQNDRSGGYTKNVCPTDPGKWHDYVLHVKWSNSNSGLLEMWRDGQKLISFNAANCVGAESNYLKQGIYRDKSPATHVVWHDGLKIYKM